MDYISKFGAANNKTATKEISKAQKSKPTTKASPKQPEPELNRKSSTSSSNHSSEDENEDDDKETFSKEESNTTSNNQPSVVQSDFIKSLSGEPLKLFNDIYTCCATNNPTRLKQIFDDRVHSSDAVANALEAESQSLLIESLLNKRLNSDLGFCLLHLTSQLGFAECVWLLLLNGANPAQADLSKQHRLPYFLSLNKSTRDTYRR